MQIESVELQCSAFLFDRTGCSSIHARWSSAAHDIETGENRQRGSGTGLSAIAPTGAEFLREWLDKLAFEPERDRLSDVVASCRAHGKQYRIRVGVDSRRFEHRARKARRKRRAGIHQERLGIEHAADGGLKDSLLRAEVASEEYGVVAGARSHVACANAIVPVARHQPACRIHQLRL